MADSTDASVPWSFKLKTIQGSNATYTDLDGKLGLEVLGDSLVGTAKGVSSVAPAKAVSLGKAQGTLALRAEVVFSDTEGFDFYGTVVTMYIVTQAAGKTVATWMPGACTAKMTGTYRSVRGENASTAAVTAVIGAFKVSTVLTSAPAGTVSVLGGTLPAGSLLAGQVVDNFFIGNTEVTWGEWTTVRDWAVNKGYGDLSVGAGAGDNYPVTRVSWFDVVKWCNARSEKEGRTPVYQANGATYKSGEAAPTVKTGANGYRLPTDAEWEWAARGGRQKHGYTYSGSNDLNAVGWYSDNSGGATHAVGTKAANELGILDMTGNVWEWCESWYDVNNLSRVIRGGDWENVADLCTVVARYSDGPEWTRAQVGFRVALSAVP